MGVTRKIYDLEFATKNELIKAAENAPTMLLNQPFYLRTSLKNNTSFKAEGEEEHKNKQVEKERKADVKEYKKGNKYAKGKGDKWNKKPYGSKIKDTHIEYVQKKTEPYVRNSEIQKNKESEYYSLKTADKTVSAINKHKEPGVQNKQQTNVRKTNKYYQEYPEKSKVANKGYDNRFSNEATTYKRDNKDRQDKKHYESKKEEHNNHKSKQKYQARQPKEPQLKFKTLDPQEVINQQRASKVKTKQNFATQNIFELLDVSD